MMHDKYDYVLLFALTFVMRTTSRIQGHKHALLKTLSFIGLFPVSVRNIIGNRFITDIAFIKSLNKSINKSF